MREDLEEIYYTKQDIKTRVSELGEQITKVYKGYDEITIISIINGAIYFTVDILRNINVPIRLDCIRVSSYGSKPYPDKKPEISVSIRLGIKNQHVLLIDDILDTGNTISMVYDYLNKCNPSSLLTCILLEKDCPRETSFKADFIGFKVPDKFIVGYGLDYAERYRNLPYIGSLKTELLNPV